MSGFVFADVSTDTDESSSREGTVQDIAQAINTSNDNVTIIVDDDNYGLGLRLGDNYLQTTTDDEYGVGFARAFLDMLSAGLAFAEKDEVGKEYSVGMSLLGNLTDSFAISLSGRASMFDAEIGYADSMAYDTKLSASTPLLIGLRWMPVLAIE